MDPVKEKLNQLKKLANERKAAHLNNKACNDQQEQEKFVKFVRNKLNNFIGGVAKQSNNEHDNPELRKIRAENQKRNEIQYQKSVETIEKEKAESLSQEKYEKLQKEIEVITAPIESKPNQGENLASSEADSLLVFDDTNNQQKIRSISIDNGCLNKETISPPKNVTIISTPKEPLKSFTINNNNDNTVINTNNKYINRIRNLYDNKKESRSLSRDHNSHNKYRHSQAPIATYDDAPKTSPDELTENLQTSSQQQSEQESQNLFSLQSASENSNWESNVEAVSPRPSKNYVQSMLDAFGGIQNNNEQANDLERMMQQRMLIENIPSEPSSNNRFDRLRERFSSREESSNRFEEKMKSPSLTQTSKLDEEAVILRLDFVIKPVFATVFFIDN